MRNRMGVACPDLPDLLPPGGVAVAMAKQAKTGSRRSKRFVKVDPIQRLTRMARLASPEG